MTACSAPRTAHRLRLKSLIGSCTVSTEFMNAPRWRWHKPLLVVGRRINPTLPKYIYICHCEIVLEACFYFEISIFSPFPQCVVACARTANSEGWLDQLLTLSRGSRSEENRLRPVVWVQEMIKPSVGLCFPAKFTYGQWQAGSREWHSWSCCQLLHSHLGYLGWTLLFVHSDRANSDTNEQVCREFCF